MGVFGGEGFSSEEGVQVRRFSPPERYCFPSLFLAGGCLPSLFLRPFPSRPGDSDQDYADDFFPEPPSQTHQKIAAIFLCFWLFPARQHGWGGILRGSLPIWRCTPLFWNVCGPFLVSAVPATIVFF